MQTDSSENPQPPKIICTPQETSLVKFLAKVYPFLTLEDFAFGIFNVSKHLYELFNLEPIILCHLAKNYYLSVPYPHPNIRKFFKHLSQRFAPQKTLPQNLEDIITQLNLRLYITKNLIRNPYGKKDFALWHSKADGGSGWIIGDSLTQKHRKHCFASSYEWCKMSYDIIYSDLSLKARTLLEEKKGVLKFGCYIARRWDCESQGYFELTVTGSEGKIIHMERIEKRFEDLPVGTSERAQYVLISTEYRIKEGKIPSKFVVTIAGKDRRWWAGNYGARFSGVFAICDFKENALSAGQADEELQGSLETQEIQWGQQTKQGEEADTNDFYD